MSRWRMVAREVRVAAPASWLRRSGEPDLGGDGGQGFDDERDVRIEIHPELGGSAVDVVAIDRTREGLVLQLFLHRRGFQTRDDLAGPDEGAGVDESGQLVARKFGAAHAKGLVPILCVGEQLADRDAGRTREVVARQLEVVLELCGAGALEAGVVAYEPVWAIGTGRNATPEQAQDVHEFIRARIGARDARISAATRILYGGSAQARQAARRFSTP